MDIHAIESAAQVAWPALLEQSAQTGVLRFAGGVSRRSNSMNPYLDRVHDWQQLCAETEQFFSTHGLPATVKVLAGRPEVGCDFAALDRHLQISGYRKEGDTLVLGKSLNADETPAKSDVQYDALGLSMRLCRESAQEWSVAWHQVRGLEIADVPAHAKIIASLNTAHYLLCLRDSSGAALATGLAVCHGATLGIFGVGTIANWQRQGLSRVVMQHLLRWGYGQGATFTYLQVEQDNTAARCLYESLGYHELYSYWYRVKSLHCSKGL